MTPEEAQNRTEEEYLKVFECGFDPNGDSAWCTWAEFGCDFCPVPAVFHDVCTEIPEYIEWSDIYLDCPSQHKPAAWKVYTLFVSKRDELITMAKKMREDA